MTPGSVSASSFQQAEPPEDQAPGQEVSAPAPSPHEVQQRDAAPDELTTERGRTSIADGIVEKIAGIAAREVAGVYALGSSASRAVGSMTQKVGIGDEHRQGVSVEVGRREAAVDLKAVLRYGSPVPETTKELRETIVQRIESITGLSVTEVNVVVADFHFPDESDEPAPARVH